jgi:deoxyadenosine/deoxycytidine kinase
MKQLRIGIVGPCAAGKTTLVAGLKQHGYSSKHIAQEHSGVPNMWQRLSDPEVLIYLDVSYPMTLKRRNISWTEQEYKEQVYRLRHARQHANFYLHTDSLQPQEVLHITLSFLDSFRKSNFVGQSSKSGV